MNKTSLVVSFVIILILLGADWTRFYGPPGTGIKFIRIETSIGPAYLNCAHIISIRRTNMPSRQGQTEIILIQDGIFTDESVESVVNRIIEY